MTDQNSQFFAILTAVGEAKQANANALGVPWTFAQMGVGDANNSDPVPSRTQTRLINERRRAPLNQLSVDPKDASIIIAEQVIPPDVGGWWIREIGLYDTAGDLVAVANCAPSYKPLLAQGTGKTQVVRLNLVVTSTANVQLKIDPAVVLATRSYVDQLFVANAQTSSYDGTLGKLAKVGYMGWGSSYVDGPMLLGDMAGDQAIFSGLYRYSPETVGRPAFGSNYGSVMQASLSNAGGNWATQLVIDYAADAIGFRRLSGAAGWQPFIEIWHKGNLVAATQSQANSGVDDKAYLTSKTLSGVLSAQVVQATEATKGIARVATQSQTNSGVDDTTMITPKKFSAGLASLIIQATEAIAGIARVATQVQAEAGVDDSTIITPRKMRWGFQMLKAPQGYLVLPTWLGGFILQWGYASIPATSTSIPFVLSYPTACASVVCTPFNVTGYADVVELTAVLSNTGFTAVGVSSGASGVSVQSATNFHWFSIGY